jgi:hypothetical protein
MQSDRALVDNSRKTPKWPIVDPTFLDDNYDRLVLGVIVCHSPRGGYIKTS